MFSFNNPYGACPTCLGLGVKEFFDPALIVPNHDLSLREGAVLPWGEKSTIHFMPFLEALVNRYKIDIREPYREIPQEVREVILYGSKEDLEFYSDRGGKRHFVKKPFEGVIKELERDWENADFFEKARLERYINLIPCPSCNGARLKKEMLWVKVNDLNIDEATRMTIARSLDFFSTLKLSEKEREIAKSILKEIVARLKFLMGCGARLHCSQPEFRHPLLGGIAEDPPCDADRVRADRGSLCAGRAKHRAPPERQ